MSVSEQAITTLRNQLVDAGYWDLEENLKKNEPMNTHTSFRVGGPAEIYAEPTNLKEVIMLIQIAKSLEIPYYLMGNGSNIVVSDDGIDGIVIRLGEKFSSIWTETKDDDPDHVYIHAYAGALLSKVSSRAVKHELTGLEFASGIPGSIGGAVFMNAGAYGRDMSCVVDSALCITNEGETYVIEGHEFAYGYRSSRFMALGGIVMSVVLKLERGDPEVIQATIKDLAEKRNASQPLNFPSAGCMFKRPEGYYAGVLIEEAGLKGVSVGGAEVSEKHAGFVINKGGATATDIADLVKKIQATVKEKSGVSLETEVRFIGKGFSQPKEGYNPKTTGVELHKKAKKVVVIPEAKASTAPIAQPTKA